MKWPKLATNPLSDHQVAEYLKATSRGNLAVLGGSPGTGKTFLSAQAVKAIGEEIGYDEIVLGAPTGKAAVRSTEAMAAYGIPLRARTWHSILRVDSADGGGWSFVHGRGNRLPYAVLIGDESSMLDVDLAASIFAARGRGAKFLLIGDVNQLPPVGHGAPLRDMIAADCPYGELREIRRNSGGIVQACAEIRDGRPFRCEGNLRHVPGRDAGEIQDAMLETVRTAATSFGLHPVWDVQVLTPTNKSGDLSRRKLNKILQNHLNANDPVPNSPFRRGDKVINTRNGWFILEEQPTAHEGIAYNASGDVYVANGEIGEVLVCEPQRMVIAIQTPRRVVKIGRQLTSGDDEKDKGEEDETDSATTNTGCSFDLAYAISTHKSQGSQWPVVVVILDDSGAAMQVCSREHIYTSISRAEQCCYLVGQLATANRYCRKRAISERKTFLKERILQSLAAF